MSLLRDNNNYPPPKKKPTDVLYKIHFFLNLGIDDNFLFYLISFTGNYKHFHPHPPSLLPNARGHRQNYAKCNIIDYYIYIVCNMKF